MAKRQRPEAINGKTTQYQTNCGKLYLTLNQIEGHLGEIRVTLGKSGHCQECLLTVNSILLSIILQEDYTPEQLKKKFKRHLLGVSCGEPFVIKGTKYTSCIDLIAQKCMLELENESKEIIK